MVEKLILFKKLNSSATLNDTNKKTMHKTIIKS
jgi:hypothetical protein